MEDFKNYLLNKRIVPEHKLVHYEAWVKQFYRYCKKDPDNKVSDGDID